MKRLLVYLLLGILLAACAPKTVILPEAVPTASPPAVQVCELVFAVDTRLDPVFATAAQTFAEKVNGMSSGKLDVTVTASSGAAADFAAGNAQFTFVDSKTDADFSSYFHTLSAPYRYKNYENFSVLTNSRRLLDFVGEDMQQCKNALPLAAFYQGSNMLVSRFQMSAVRKFERAEDETPFTGITIPGTGASVALEALGVKITEEVDVSERAFEIVEGSAQIAEFTTAELNTVDFSDTGLFLTQSNHTINPKWLVVKEDFYTALSRSDKAALTEACGYLFHIIDDYFLAREAATIAKCKAQGVTSGGNFGSVRASVRTELGLADAADSKDKYLVDLLQSIS